MAHESPLRLCAGQGCKDAKHCLRYRIRGTSQWVSWDLERQQEQHKDLPCPAYTSSYTGQRR